MSGRWRRRTTPSSRAIRTRPRGPSTHRSRGTRCTTTAGLTAAGRDSVTHYRTLEAFRAASLLEVHLETGRTHQIRVHFAALRHPCAGDLTYGADPSLADRLGLHRQWLHAVRLGFQHPAHGRWVEFASPYPDDLDAALARLRQ